MKTAKFLASLLLGFTLVYAAYLAILKPLAPAIFNREYSMWRHGISQLENTNSRPEYLFLGDSRFKAGVIPDGLRPESVNLSLGGFTPIEAHYYLKRYVTPERREKLKHVSISFIPFHVMKIDSFWQRGVKFGFFKASEIREILSQIHETKDYATVKGQVAGLERFFSFDFLVSDLLFRFWAPQFMEADYLFSDYAENRRGNEYYAKLLETSRGHVLFGRSDSNSDLNGEAGEADFVPSPLLRRYLERTFDDLLAQGLEVSYFTVPMNESSFRALKKPFVPSFDRYFAELKAAYEPRGVKFYEKISYYPDDHFGDASHVNQRGAERFTRELCARLKICR